MGCDIHLVVERFTEPYPGASNWICVSIAAGWTSTYQTKHGTNWFSPACLSRNYERFANLAGVRGEGPPARGLPHDASASAAYLSESEDFHSHSWLPIAEAARIFAETELLAVDASELQKKFPISHYFGIDDDGNYEKYRIVFWFDN